MKRIKHNSSVTPEMIEAIEIEYNEDPVACSECGGRCCMNMGCEVYPQDVKRWFKTDTITKEMIVKLLDSGKVQIDWWDGDVRDEEFDYTEEQLPDEELRSKVYYLHMRNGKDAAIEGSWGGVCKCFTPEKGCSLTWEQRPTGGRAVEPKQDWRECKNKMDKPLCCMAWIPYQEMFDEVVETYENGPTATEQFWELFEATFSGTED